jgi:hypothetical protein
MKVELEDGSPKCEAGSLEERKKEQNDDEIIV